MPTLHLVRGVPGSGKSTFARSLCLPNHFEADQYFEYFTEGRFVPSQIKTAHNWCQIQTEVAMRRKEDIVVANTFIRHWEMAHYLTMASYYDYDVKIHVMTGTYQNIHGVPPEKVEQMRANFEE